MLSSLYGNLPPPEAASTSADGDNASSAVQLNSSSVAGKRPGMSSAWSTNRAKLFMPPTLRVKLPAHHQQTAGTLPAAAPTAGHTVATSSSAVGAVPPHLQQSVASSIISSSSPAGYRGGRGSLSGSSAAATSAALEEEEEYRSPQAARRDFEAYSPPPEHISTDTDPKATYDPWRPNSYDKVLAERDLNRRMRDAERQLTEDADRQREARNRQKQQSSNRNATGGPSGESPATGTETAPAQSGKKGLAMKIMEQMGWKSGEGLGREKQGIVTPLVARKTDKKSGVIVQGVAAPGAPQGTADSPTAVPAHLWSRVVVLLNLVGRNGVDACLESEVAEEASRHGNLQAVKIKLLPDNVPDDRAVRVFLKYEAKEDAARAQSTFNGRFFGGRVVSSGFYDEVVHHRLQKQHADCITIYHYVSLLREGILCAHVCTIDV